MSITKLNFTFHVCVIPNEKNVSGIDIISERNIKGTVTSKKNIQGTDLLSSACFFYKILCIKYTLG